jgi:hypothetical protein
MRGLIIIAGWCPAHVPYCHLCDQLHYVARRHLGGLPRCDGSPCRTMARATARDADDAMDDHQQAVRARPAISQRGPAISLEQP